MTHYLTKSNLAPLLAFLLRFAASTSYAEEKERDWITLFNDKYLSGWTPKISGFPCGVNALNTFRADNGILKVSYDAYDKFN